MMMSDVERRRRRVEEMRGKRERRTCDTPLTLRSSGGGLALVGYACATGMEYEIGNPERSGFVEVVRQGAFTRTLGNSPDVILLAQHGDALSGLPLARTKSGTLRLSEDRHGLRVDATLDIEDPDVQILRRKFARGDLDGQMSFAFTVPKGGDSWSEDYRHRTITTAEINQGDVSLVNYGANPYTSSKIVARNQSLVPDHTTSARAALMRLKVVSPRRRVETPATREARAALERLRRAS